MTSSLPNGASSPSAVSSLLDSVKSAPMKPVDVTPLSTAPAPLPETPVAPLPPPPPDFFDKGPAALTPAVEVAPQVETPSEPELTEEQRVEQSKAESLTTLRKKAREAQERFDAISAEHEEAKSKLSRYESGEEVPEKVQRLEERIGKLEPFEKLHAFKLSEEYQREYIEPIAELETRAKELAEEYAVDIGKLNGAFKQPNRRELNKYLIGIFGGDEVAALEARDIVDAYKEKVDARRDAETNAAAEWDRIRAEDNARRERDTTQKLESFKKATKSYWANAFEEIKSSGNFQELDQPETSPHYATITKPLIEASQRNMGMLSRWLAEQGIKEIPKEIGDFLAKASILAQVAPVTAASRAEHSSRASQLLANTQRQSAHHYPGVGSRGTGFAQPNGPIGPRQPRTAEEFAQAATSLLPRK